MLAREFAIDAPAPLTRAEQGRISIIPGHHAQVPVYMEGAATSTGVNANLPLSVSAAMDHLHHERRLGEAHGIVLPKEFNLGQYTVEVFHTGARMAMSITDTVTLKTFRTLPEFMQHLVETGYAAALPFYVEEYIDSARKQIGFKYRKQRTVNPEIHNEFACTPDCVYRFLREEWGKTLSEFDPAPRDPQVDSLTVPWHCKPGETIYVNPPFKHIPRWGAKILEELRSGRVQNVVLIMPGRVSTDWFHDIVVRYATRAVASKHSLRFKGYSHSIPTGVIIADLCAPLRENTHGLTLLSARLHDWDNEAPTDRPQHAADAAADAAARPQKKARLKKTAGLNTTEGLDKTRAKAALPKKQAQPKKKARPKKNPGPKKTAARDAEACNAAEKIYNNATNATNANKQTVKTAAKKQPASAITADGHSRDAAAPAPSPKSASSSAPSSAPTPAVSDASNAGSGQSGQRAIRARPVRRARPAR